MSTADNNAASQATAPAPAPADPVGIPNIARTPPRRLQRRTVVLACCAAAAAVAVGGATAWKLQRNAEAREAARKAAATPRAAAATASSRQIATGPLVPVSMTAAQAPAPAPAPAPARHAVPALRPDPGDGIEPIPVVGARRSSGGGGSGSAARPAIDPRDAPMMLASAKGATGMAEPVAAGGGDEIDATRAHLRQYRQQVGTLVQQLQQRAAGGPAGMVPTALPGVPLATATATPGLPAPAQAPAVALPAPALQRGTVVASQLSDRSLTVPKGTVFTCHLKTRVVSAVAGDVACIVTRNVYGDDGRVLLVERGSHIDGEYRLVNVRPGMTRIPVLWTRIRTPHGITVDLDSNATGQLGEAGMDGHVDNRWPERIGAALLLSLIDDAVRIEIADRQASSGGAVVVGGGTLDTGSKLAEEVLKTTINIPPLLYRNQGGTVGVYVRHDLDFSRVYALQPR